VKTVIEVQLRQAPIQFVETGERIVDRAGIGAQAIGQASIEIAGIGIADQGIQAMPRTLGFGFYLEGIITGGAYAVVVSDALKGRSVGERWEAAPDGYSRKQT